MMSFIEIMASHFYCIIGEGCKAVFYNHIRHHSLLLLMKKRDFSIPQDNKTFIFY